jgi:hypothetical protein
MFQEVNHEPEPTNLKKADRNPIHRFLFHKFNGESNGPAIGVVLFPHNF